MSLIRVMPLFFFTLLLPLRACAWSSEAIEGQVLEQGSHTPISGAIVVGLWHGIAAHGYVESRTVCYHADSTVTDAGGRFSLPATEKEKAYRRQHHYVSLTVYKPAYEQTRTDKTTVYLSPFTGAREGRLKYLLQVLSTSSCGAQDQSEQSLIPLRRHLYDEALKLAETAHDQKSVEAILYRLEILELGFEEAGKRHFDRVQGQ